ncbi:MAG TPA: hypothetical protein VK069_04615 [Mycolicibacillus parakoreensis]|nr:hypothetical protein [Mycolicibacillus parakoreensis]
MTARDPATPEPTDNAQDRTDALTLAEAEAEAAEAAAEAARTRAALLRLRNGGDDPDGAPPAAVTTGEDGKDDEDDQTRPPTDEDDATTGAQTPAQQAPRRARRLHRIARPLRWVAATLAVLATGGLIAAAVMILIDHHGVQQRERVHAEYAAAARQGVVTLMSLNYETVEDDVQDILDNTTGDFRQDFADHAEDFTKVAREAKTVTEATATVAGVESSSDTDAVVLVAAETKVTNTAGAKDEPRSWRLSVHLTREGDQIKMSKVDFAA